MSRTLTGEGAGVLATSGARTTAALVGAATLAVLAYLLPFPPLPRAVVEVTFLLVCPGLALVRPLGLPRLATAALAVGVSLVLGQLTAMVLMYADVWDPAVALVTLALLTAGAAFLPRERPRHLRGRG